jgi:hypothetical protein
MRRIKALAVPLGLVAAFVLCVRFYQAHAAGQRAQQPATSSSEPVYVGWPLAATGKAYATIDGKHLWQYVRDQADIAERYRDQGHSQFWGRIAGTSGDVEDVQWLLKKYQQIGLTDTHSQTVALFLPQWAPESWDVTATAGGKTMKLTSAQPPYGAASTDGKVLDLPAAYVGLGSDADFAGRDVRGKAVLFIRDGVDVQRRTSIPGAHPWRDHWVDRNNHSESVACGRFIAAAGREDCRGGVS